MIGSTGVPSKLDVVTSYRGISGYHSNKMVITETAMKELRAHLPFTQLRFDCSKEPTGRRFHVATATNNSGEAVVQFFSGQTNVLPDSCGSFVRMENDNSKLAQVCDRWGSLNGVLNVGKWSKDVPPKQNVNRLYHLSAFVAYLYSWRTSPAQSTFECDDYASGVSPGNFWKVFVR